MDGLVPYVHEKHTRDYLPEHLEPSDEELNALFKSVPGEELTGNAAKTARKLFYQSPKERRYLVGDIFYTPSLEQWHFFYSDQRDLKEGESNHWRGESHVHLINWLWPEHDAQSLWSKFISGNVKNVQIGGAFHLKFVR